MKILQQKQFTLTNNINTPMDLVQLNVVELIFVAVEDIISFNIYIYCVSALKQEILQLDSFYLFVIAKEKFVQRLCFV